MIIDCKKIFKERLKSIKNKNSLLKMRGVNASFSIIRTTNINNHKNYIQTLKRYCKDCDIKLNIIDMIGENDNEKIIRTIDMLNSDFSVHGILLENGSISLNNEIIPYKDLNGLSIPNAGSLMHNKETIAPCIVKSISDIIKYNNIKLKNSNVLILFNTEEDNYIKYTIEILRREGCTITIANQNTKNLSSLFYDKNLILIANNKKGSIGYNLLENIDMYINEQITNEIKATSTYFIDLNMHQKTPHDIMNGNIEYNNEEEIFKYAKLDYVKITPAGDYINLALINLLENVIILANKQFDMYNMNNSFL